MQSPDHTIAPDADPSTSFRARWVFQPSHIVGLVIFLLVLFLPTWMNDADTYWHIAAGNWILAHRTVPMTDPFSWTMFGQPWSAHEWLSELLMASAFKLAGLSGVVLLASFAVGLSAFLLIRFIQPILPGRAIVVAMVCALWPLAPVLLARPHILAFPALVCWCGALVQARRRQNVPSLFYLPVMTIWANLHGGFMLGLFFAVALGFEAVMVSPGLRWDVGKRWSVFCLAAILAAAMTPQGWHGLFFPFQLLHRHALVYIIEWRPTDLKSVQMVDILIPVALYLMVIRGVRISLFRLLIVGFFIWSAIEHQRNQMFLGIMGTLLLADAARSPDQDEVFRSRSLMGAGWLLSVLAILAVGLRLTVPPKTNDVATPTVGLAHLDPALTKQPVFNDYQFGGYLIFRHIRPFIDGRVDMYGDDFMETYEHMIVGGPVLRDYLAHNPVRWTMLLPNSPAAKAMDHMPGWKRIYIDKIVVIHARIS